MNTGMEYEDILMRNQELMAQIEQLRKQRDEAWLKIGHIRNEIDCRIEHGADSNGHLEAIRNMIDKEEADSNNELFRKGQI